MKMQVFCFRAALTFMLASPFASKCLAGVASGAIGETTEVVMRKFGKEVAEESADAVSKRVAEAGAKFGEEGLEAIGKVGPRAFGKITIDAGENAPQVVKLTAKYGDQAVWVISKPRGLAVFVKYGEEGATAIMKHPGVAEGAVESLGVPAARALNAVSGGQARRLGMMIDDGAIKTGEQTAGSLAEPQMDEKMHRLKREIATLARLHLPGSRDPVLNLANAVSGMPAQALEELLGSERLIAPKVRGRFRSLLLERTPIFLFPWRLTLSIANLIHGATDRFPLAMIGSPISILTTAWTAVKNVKDAHAFDAQITSGFRSQINGRIKDLASPQFQAIDFVLQRDLRLDHEQSPRTGITSTANLRGLETLQARSTELFHATIEKFAPSSAVAWLFGLVGFALFWSIFGWPVYGLYQDFGAAAAEMLARQKTSLEAFPARTFSMLTTSAILAVLPMGLFLLCAIEFLTRQSKVLACVSELRAAHAIELDRLTSAGLLAVELTEPRIDACHLLLMIERTEEAPITLGSIAC